MPSTEPTVAVVLPSSTLPVTPDPIPPELPSNPLSPLSNNYLAQLHDSSNQNAPRTQPNQNISFFQRHKTAIALTIFGELAVGVGVAALATYAHFSGNNLLTPAVPMLNLEVYQAALMLSGAILLCSALYLGACKLKESCYAPAAFVPV